jgi:phosphatidylinositol alpha 1,6-mannosyltransferase
VSRGLRVCIVTDAFLPGVGGIENHVLHLSAGLQRLGHEVLVVTHEVPANAPVIEAQVVSPVPAIRLPGRLLIVKDHDIAIDPGMLRAFRRLLKERQFDIVHGQSEGSFLVYGALAAARRHGLPTVLTRHSMLGMKPALLRPLLKELVRRLLGSADGVIAVSTACAREIRLGSRKLKVIPNGVETGAFRPKPDVRQRVRAELGLAADDVVVGNVGRLHVSKGTLMLVEAFERLRAGNPKLRLLLCGPGPLHARIAKRTTAFSNDVRLLGATAYDRVPGILNALDIFALPSFGEAFGISLLEAMACGVPGVALDRWGVRDLVRSGETGFLVATQDEFRDRLAKLAADPDLRREMGLAARARAETFSWARVVEETVGFYQEVAGGRRSVAGDRRLVAGG